MKRLALTLLSIAIATTLISTGAISLAAAQADQAWPSRPVKLILPLGAGSGTDTIARLFADQLAKRWGKPVVVENRPGGDGIIAINAFLSANDDHTLLFTATSRGQVQAGRVKMLALTNSKPQPIAPDLPTVIQAGYPSLVVDGLVGFFAPKELETAARDKIAADVRSHQQR